MEEKQVNEKTEKAKKAKNRTSLKNIIGGDILATDFFRRQTKLLVMIMLLIIFYIHNRYACQQQMIEIDKLKKELIDIKYDALTRSSELMERSRQSRIEEYIASKGRELAISLPSDERMLPRLGFTVTFSFTKRSATSCQYCRSANMMTAA